MNRNLFFMELKRNALSIIAWTLAITVLISVTMSVYNTFVANQSKVIGMLNLVPKGLLQFKGVSSFSDFLSVLGFYSVNNIIYMMVLGSIFAIVLSSNILLREEYNKTAEYLLTRPLTRSEIFISKSAVLFLYILVLNVVTALAGLICIEIVRNGEYSNKAFFILTLYTFLLNLMFGSIGLFLSTLVKKPKPITTLCIGVVLILYFIFTLSKITESADGIGYISPFKFVNVNATDPAYKLSGWHLLYFLGTSALLTGISYRLYSRKDIYT